MPSLNYDTCINVIDKLGILKSGFVNLRQYNSKQMELIYNIDRYLDLLLDTEKKVRSNNYKYQFLLYKYKGLIHLIYYSHVTVTDKTSQVLANNSLSFAAYYFEQGLKLFNHCNTAKTIGAHDAAEINYLLYYAHNLLNNDKKALAYLHTAIEINPLYNFCIKQKEYSL